VLSFDSLWVPNAQGFFYAPLQPYLETLSDTYAKLRLFYEGLLQWSFLRKVVQRPFEFLREIHPVGRLFRPSGPATRVVSMPPLPSAARNSQASQATQARQASQASQSAQLVPNQTCFQNSL